MSDGAMFICGKCGSEVDKEAEICPSCHAKLGNIRCPFCRFVGTAKDFATDRCPRCGKKKTLQVPQIMKKATTNKLPAETQTNKYYDDFLPEQETFISRYFPFIFIFLLLFTGGLLIVFLTYFNFW